MTAADNFCVMATVFRVLLWALVLIAPGGILLAPFLAGYEMRRRNAQRAADPAANGAGAPASAGSVVAVAAAR
jgi:hypothetical protein